MPNRGTPYDKYCKGWGDEGDPPYSRRMRDSFAINDSLSSEQDDFEPCSCEYTWDEDCLSCLDRRSASEKIIESRRKHKHTKPPRDPGGPARKAWRSWRYSRNATDTTPEEASTCQHVWVERTRWLPRPSSTHYWTREVTPPCMELHRYWVCKECRGEKDFGVVKQRRDLSTLKPQHGRWRTYRRGHEVVTRDMTPQELEQYWKKETAPKTKTGQIEKVFGTDEDGRPILRNEFKQAERKRLERKRKES